MNICVTGHRPNKLWGYGDDPRYEKLYEQLKDTIMRLNADVAYTGMALGVDQMFAKAVIELRDSGVPIKLHCAIPCLCQDGKWPDKSRKEYADILSKADTVTLLAKEMYRPALMMQRNHWMVDNSQVLIAVWSGAPGGTTECVQYATSLGREVIVINPEVM